MYTKLNFKKSIAIICIVLVIYTLFNLSGHLFITAKKNTDNEVLSGYKITSSDIEYYRDMLTTSSEEKFYSDVLEAIKEQRQIVEIPFKLPSKDVSKIIDFVKLDHPELFWFDGDYIENSDAKRITYVSLLYNKSSSDLIDNMEKINESIENIVSEANKYNSDVEKIAYCYSKIIDELTYNEKATCNQSLYSAAVPHETVCFGYSKYFYTCLNKLGYENVIILGNTRESSDGYKAHSWNAVKINNEWYYFDLTWADSFDTDEISYFMVPITDEIFNSEHKAEYNIPLN